MEEPGVPQGLRREQKVGFVLLLLFCIIAIGLGFLQMRNTIYGPFVFRPTPKDDTEALFSDEEVKLQSIDTDHDGLNNYEELYFHQTSPYLPDTDSDKIDDKAEIEKGSNPLCPEGNDCSQATAASALVVTSTLPAPPEPPSSLGLGAGLTPTTTITADNMESAFKDPAQLRKLLLQYGGITEAQLLNIPDETLLQYATQVLGGSPQTTSTPATSSTTPSR